MDAAHRSYIRRETLIGIVLNTIVSAVFVWLMFRGLDAIGLWGMQGLAFDLVPTTFMITLMTTIALTFITRARLRDGSAPALAPRGWRPPAFPPVRGVLLGLAFTLALVPAAVGVLSLVWRRDWTFNEVLVFKMIYGAVLGAVVTPIVLRLALMDRAMGERATA